MLLAALGDCLQHRSRWSCVRAVFHIIVCWLQTHAYIDNRAPNARAGECISSSDGKAQCRDSCCSSGADG